MDPLKAFELIDELEGLDFVDPEFDDDDVGLHLDVVLDFENGYISHYDLHDLVLTASSFAVHLYIEQSEAHRVRACFTSEERS